MPVPFASDSDSNAVTESVTVVVDKSSDHDGTTRRALVSEKDCGINRGS